MKRMITDINHAGMIEAELIDAYIEQLAPEIKQCASGGQTAYAFADLGSDKELHKQVSALADEKKALHPCMLIVVGIGGSNLGTMAVQQALFGRLYNDLSPSLQIYYADTVDTDYLHSILTVAEEHLKQGKRILVNVVSKSGKTTETIVNFELFLHLLKKYHPNDYADSIVVTTDKDSLLWQMAQQAGWNKLTVPTSVGGRYSVLSPVGLFPLAMLDIDIKELLEGAAYSATQCVKKDRANPAAASAAWHYALCKKGYAVSNLFLFSNELRGLGKWWRQLMAESLGKAIKRDGTPNKDALLPIMSLGTTDLHSMGQLYLANIMPIMTTFITFDQERFDYTVPDYPPFDQLVANIQGACVADIMKTVVQGVKKAYKQEGLPYRTITLPEKSAYYIGQFLQQSMFEVVYIGYLLGVNPFDQPAVELYKQKTRELLANE